MFWTEKGCKNYQVVMAVSLLHKHADVIMESQLDFTAILKVTNTAVTLSHGHVLGFSDR